MHFFLDFYGFLVYFPFISTDFVLNSLVSMKFYAFHLILFEFFGILWNPREFNGILSFPLISIHFCLASLDFHAFFLKYTSNDFF